MLVVSLKALLNAPTTRKLTPAPMSTPFFRVDRGGNFRLAVPSGARRRRVPVETGDIGDKSGNDRGGVDDKGWLMNVAAGRAGSRGEALPRGYCSLSFLPSVLP